MYEFTIEKILEYDKITSKMFLGAFARDELPKKIEYPACFIANTHTRQEPGQHWLAFYYDKKGICYFFDSYGRSPIYYKFREYIENTSNKCIYNKQRIQGQSHFCGLYCIFFLLFKVRNKERIFFNKFTKNYAKNDNFIQESLTKYSN